MSGRPWLITAISTTLAFVVSLFHVRPWQMMTNNGLYAAVLFPNLIKELVGYKTQ